MFGAQWNRYGMDEVAIVVVEDEEILVAAA